MYKRFAPASAPTLYRSSIQLQSKMHGGIEAIYLAFRFLLQHNACTAGYLHVGTMMFMNLNRIHVVIGINGNDVSNINHINLYLDWFRIQAFGEDRGFQQVGTQ